MQIHGAIDATRYTVSAPADGAALFTGFPNNAPRQAYTTPGRLVPRGVGLFAIHLHGCPFLQSSSPII